jgi:hypothetical protein
LALQGWNLNSVTSEACKKLLNFKLFTKGAVMLIHHLGYGKSVDRNKIPRTALKAQDPQKAHTVMTYPCD